MILLVEDESGYIFGVILGQLVHSAVTVQPSLKRPSAILTPDAASNLQCHCLHLVGAGLKLTQAICHPEDQDGKQQKQQHVGGGGGLNLADSSWSPLSLLFHEDCSN